MPSEKEGGREGGRERGREGEREGGREAGRKSGEEGSDICFPLPSDTVRPLVSGPSLATWSGVLGVAGTCSLLPPGCQGSHIYHLFEEEMCNATWWVERCGMRGGEVWCEGWRGVGERDEGQIR